MRNPILKNVETGHIIEIFKSPFSIGRSLECDYVIENKIISRKHFELTCSDEGWSLTDSSTNGTLVNEGHYKGKTSPILKHYDEISLGYRSYTYHFLTEVENVAHSQVERLRRQESNGPPASNVSSSSPSTPNSFDENGISDELLNDLADDILNSVEQDGLESSAQQRDKNTIDLTGTDVPSKSQSIPNVGDNVTTSTKSIQPSCSYAINLESENAAPSILNAEENNEKHNTLNQIKPTSEETVQSQFNSSSSTVIYSLPEGMFPESSETVLDNNQANSSGPKIQHNEETTNVQDYNATVNPEEDKSKTESAVSEPQDHFAETMEAVIQKYTQDPSISSTSNTSAPKQRKIESNAVSEPQDHFAETMEAVIQKYAQDPSNSTTSNTSTPRQRKIVISGSLTPTTISLASPMNSNKKIKVMALNSGLINQLVPVPAQIVSTYKLGEGHQAPVVRMVTRNELQKLVQNFPVSFASTSRPTTATTSGHSVQSANYLLTPNTATSTLAHIPTSRLAPSIATTTFSSNVAISTVPPSMSKLPLQRAALVPSTSRPTTATTSGHSVQSAHYLLAPNTATSTLAHIPTSRFSSNVAISTVPPSMSTLPLQRAALVPSSSRPTTATTSGHSVQSAHYLLAPNTATSTLAHIPTSRLAPSIATATFPSNVTISTLPAYVSTLASNLATSTLAGSTSTLSSLQKTQIATPTSAPNVATSALQNFSCTSAGQSIVQSEVNGNNIDLLDCGSVPAAVQEVVIDNTTESTGDIKVDAASVQMQSTSSKPTGDSQERNTSKELAKLKADNQNQFEEMENELMCTICANLFIKAITLGCSHSFCQYCINQWKKKKTDCPICRTKITSTIRTLVLDNIIEKMLENTSETDKLDRKAALDERNKMEEEEANKNNQKNARGRNTARRGRRGGGNNRGNASAETNNQPTVNPVPPPAPPPVITIADSPSTTDNDSDENTDYDYDGYNSDEWYNGRPGAYFGGYGRCFNCGDRGHWANGCPYR